MRPKMLGIKLSFVGSGFDFFAVPTLFNVKKFCLITLQKSKPRKRNGVQEAAGSTPVTRAKKQSSQCGGCFFRSGDRDQRPLANSNSPLGVPNAKRRHAAGSTPVTRTKLTKRYRCVWRKARRINRFRAFSGPDSFFQTIDANRCFRASALI